MTGDQFVQVNSICNQFERAWQQGQSPTIEAAAAGAESRIRPALLQHLAELDIQCRVTRGSMVDLDSYLTRWPDLDRNLLEEALEMSRRTGETSRFIGASTNEPAPLNSGARVCSLTEFVSRLRESRLLSEHEMESLTNSVTGESSSASLGSKLVEARKLTSFQATVLLEGDNDPLTLGEYVIQDRVGRGGMGTVYRAVHRRMKRVVAVKVLRQDIPHTDILLKRFLREVEVAAKLRHPNIVTAYDAGEQNGISFLVSEFVEGQNLGDLVKQYGPMSLPLAVDIVLQAARALEYAHKEGVIHRDIKPSNLLLDDTGNVKLLDVGLARVNQLELSDVGDSSDLTTTGMIMGTVDYMSPEQAQDTRLADERSDVYSLGCTLFFLIVGRAPYAKGTGIERLLAHREQPIPSFRAVSSDVPTEMDDVLASFMSKKPAKRTATMTGVIQLLESLQSVGLPDLTLPLNTLEEKPAFAAADSPIAPTRQVDRGLDESQLDATVLVRSEPTDEGASDNVSGTIFPSVDSERSSSLPELKTEDAGSLAPTRSSAGASVSAVLLVAIPGLIALAIVAYLLWPDNTMLNRPGGTRPANEMLSDFSEESVQAYRSRWAAALSTGEEQTVNGVDFVLIPPGQFYYGEGIEAEERMINKEFFLSNAEVTKGQYEAFVNASGNYQTIAERNGTGWGKSNGTWAQAPGYSWKNLGENFVSENTPVCCIAYPDAIAFCEWMSSVSGRTVRLPTEVEWEYACRCGRLGAWSFGDDETILDRYGWTAGNSRMEIHETRGLYPNAWGLFDMHGNEFEWCFEPDDVSNPSPETRPLRGGGFMSLPEEVRCSARQRSQMNEPTRGSFRVLMESE